MEQENKKNDYLLPLAIVIAALLISGSWIYTAGVKVTDKGTAQAVDALGNQPQARGEVAVNPVSQDDHILGNPDAPVKIIEFSDLECPFCKVFQATMNQVMADYNGKVAWIFREYPLDQLHSKARIAAEAAECAAQLGGNEKFWAYIDKYYETTPSNNQIDASLIPQIGINLGLDKTQYTNCINAKTFEKKINDSIADGTKAGLQGTPYSVIVAKDGTKTVINGAQPYAQVKLLIDAALK